jgi:subfamily B ATP-binding cassette protein HlyB/CyaB
MSGYQSTYTDEFNSDTGGIEQASRLFAEILISAGYEPAKIKFAELPWEEILVQVGKPLFPCRSDPGNGNLGEQLPSDLYLIGQGKVRLLTFDSIKQRFVSLAALHEGQWFGADNLLLPQGAIGYQAIGAGSGVAYRLPTEMLALLLNHYPKAGSYLSAAIRKYQLVAFFRTQPSFQQLTGRQISQLACQTEDIEIPSGCLLNRFLHRDAGVFYLRSGSIRDKTGRILQAGRVLSAEDILLEESQAITDLLVHYLPALLAEQVAGQEPLESGQKMRSTDVRESQQNISVQSQFGWAATNPNQTMQRQGTAALAVSQSRSKARAHESPQVAFPKPLKRQVLDQFQRYPWIEQQSSSDCGAACLAMICCYWGKRLPIHVLREKANVGRSGASLKSLAKGAESIGFNARPVRASFGRMAEQTNPWIAHWQGDHYIVVYRVEARRVIIADPALGKKYISRDEFKKGWSGYALLLDPTERLKEVEFQQASLGRYLKLLVPYRSLIIQILVVSLLIQLFSLVTPLFTQIILDKVVVQKSMSTLNIFAIGLVIFSAWTIVMTTVRSYLLAYFSMRLDLTMVSGFIKHAISLPLKFYETRRVGDVITRVQENQKIQRFLIGQVMLAWLGFLTGFVYLGLMLYYNFQLTLMVLALMPPIIIVTLISTPFLRKISREVFKEAANQNSNLVEMMNGIAAVKSAGVEQEVRWRWEDSLTQLKNVSFKGQKFGIGLGAVNGAINTMGSTALLWLGAAMVIQNQLTIGQFVAFNMMIGYVLSPVVALANLWDELQEIFISVERLNDVFETLPEEPASQSFFALPKIEGAVTF